jgi:putative endonuclease
MSDLSSRALAARLRAAKRWYVYLILCRSGEIYTGIALNVAARYAQHLAGTGARYTRANPPRRLLVKFACLNQSEAGRMEAAIKKLAAADKRKLIGKTGAVVRKLLFGC